MPTTRQQTLRQAQSAGHNDPPAPPTTRLRARPTAIASDFITNDTTYRPSKATPPDAPPRFIIDLSLPPEQRYHHVCAALKGEIAGLANLFDGVMGNIARYIPARWIHVGCRWALRRMRDDEETRELRGISQATGVAMYLLVCFNVLLDLFMGCSSGGAAVADDKGATRMLHFRTLDWGMPALRRVVVQLDFVTEEGGPVIASSITYAGFVGVLTGVRKGYSVSLNFRATRLRKGVVWQDALYYWHLILVLFGWRRGVASHLRSSLLPTSDGMGGWQTSSFSNTVEMMGGSPPSDRDGRQRPLETTACYLCLSDGEETVVLEKDRTSATVRRDSNFIVVTNADQHRRGDVGTSTSTGGNNALTELLADAVDRQQCAEQNWRSMCAERRVGRHGSSGPGMGLEDVVELVQRFPTTNESTHFACIMDAKDGVVRWCRRFRRPVGAKWIREHG